MSTEKKTRHGFLAASIATALLFIAFAAPASAAVGPKWRLHSVSNTTVAPGGTLEYIVQAENVGDANMDGSEIVYLAGLPSGMTVSEAKVTEGGLIIGSCFDASDGVSPVAGASSVICNANFRKVPTTLPTVVGSNAENFQKIFLTASVAAGAEGARTVSFSVSGGGAPSISTVDPVTVTEDPPVFGIDGFDNHFAATAAGDVLSQAGAHPYEAQTPIDINTTTAEPLSTRGPIWPVEPVKDISVELSPGLVGNVTALDQCTMAQLAEAQGTAPRSLCPPGSQVGMQLVRLKGSPLSKISLGPFPLFNLVPPPGVPARFGFNILGTVITLNAELRYDDDYGLTVHSRNIPLALATAGVTTTFWGVPASAGHDLERACPGVSTPANKGPSCLSGTAEVPFMRYPTACTPVGVGLPSTLRIDSWDDPGDFVERTIHSHQPAGYPAPPSDWGAETGVDGCDAVPVEGSLEAKPTAREVETSSGLSVHVEVPNLGLENPTGIASSDIKKVKVSLPQGVTINPSQAEGLGVCSPARYESTELSFHHTETGCPSDSKIGTVEVVTPLLEERIPGEVFIAQQDDPGTPNPGTENPFDSLLAIYVVLAEPQRGILVTLPGKVETDQSTGRIITTFDDLPQVPFSSFDFKFREGARAPLVTPPTCGTYTTETEIWGHSDPDGPPIVSKSSFVIDRGIGGGPCPPGGIPPFDPGFNAGSVNPSAGSYSPFLMRLTRRDGDQNMTKFNSLLPPGVSAKIAGVEKCSEVAIAAAKAAGRTGRQELASPSCPANSQIGRSLAGAGVGSVLTYVPGKIYLAGPWNGAPLSVVAITPAVAGPFDVGAVVVRQALTLDPVTAEVRVDGSKSDPIPHILEGIPLKLRDLRVYVDRNQFTINPTSCDPDEVQATLFGSWADVFDPADDRPVDRASRFQAANCASLGFKPALKLNLRGGTKRGGHPALRALFRPRAGDANLARTVVKLPRSAFLDQAHIRTVCTRVQFAADACPQGAVYGKVTAFTPLLDEPLKGPAYLRSSDNQLPDLVFDLHGVVDIETSARIDSVRGGIRATFPFVPDAPLTRVIVEMQGGKKGLIVNSRDLCAGRPSRADVKLDGHNGKVRDFRPLLRAKCGKRG